MTLASLRGGRAALVVWVSFAAAAGAAVAAPRDLAAVSPDGPVQAVRSTLREAARAVNASQSRAEKLAVLGELARRLVDTKAMARRAIGPVLEQRSDEEKREFYELFDELVVRSYLQKLLFFRRPRFAFGEKELAGDTVIVRTKILTEKDTFFVDYEMQNDSRAWRANDVVIEGIRMSENYASQFESILGSRSFGELLALMRRKVRGFRDAEPER